MHIYLVSGKGKKVSPFGDINENDYVNMQRAFTYSFSGIQ